MLKSKGPGADLKHVCKRIRLVNEVDISGDLNSGDRNTGDGNSGNGNTGDWNSGNGNCGNYHAGCLNHGDAKFFIFNKPADRKHVDFDLVKKLLTFLGKDKPIDPTDFLSLPNATPEKIKTLHEAHIKARKKLSK